MTKTTVGQGKSYGGRRAQRGSRPKKKGSKAATMQRIQKALQAREDETSFLNRLAKLETQVHINRNQQRAFFTSLDATQQNLVLNYEEE